MIAPAGLKVASSVVVVDRWRQISFLIERGRNMLRLKIFSIAVVLASMGGGAIFGQAPPPAIPGVVSADDALDLSGPVLVCGRVRSYGRAERFDHLFLDRSPLMVVLERDAQRVSRELPTSRNSVVCAIGAVEKRDIVQYLAVSDPDNFSVVAKSGTPLAERYPPPPNDPFFQKLDANLTTLFAPQDVMDPPRDRAGLVGSLIEMLRGIGTAYFERSGPTNSLLPNSAAALSFGGEHWIQERGNDGRLILLEDGSLWEISTLDRLNVRLWLPNTPIIINERTPGDGFPYLLVNDTSSQTARARFISRR